MPLSIALLTRPARVARLIGLAALAALLSGALAVGGHPLALVASPLVLLASGAMLGVLAPPYGRTAAAGLWIARAGLAIGACAVLLPGGGLVGVARVVAAFLVIVGLRTVARRARGLNDLPAWTTTVVGAGTVAALLVPAYGGGLVLALSWLAVAAVIHATSAAPAGAAPARA